MTGEAGVQQEGARIEALLAELTASADAGVGARAEELVQRLVDLYGAGLAGLLSHLSSEGVLTPSLRRRLTGDPLLSALLVLHGLHPDDPAARVEAALTRLRPYLQSHAGGVELVRVDELGTAHVRLEGTCDGCSSSAATVTQLIERAIREAAPEIVRVEVTQPRAEGATLVQLGRRAREPEPSS